MSGQPDLWSRHVRQWQWLGSPLRPAAADTRIAEELVRRWHEAGKVPAPAAMVLGVTPEIAGMRWPSGTQLVAVDHAPEMIRGIWPGAGRKRPAVCAEWHSLPLSDGSLYIVIGDGCFTVLDYPAAYRAVARELRRVLNGNGMLLLRFTARPDVPESPGAVFDALSRGRIGNFHAFKLRLAMAMQASAEAGVRLEDVHRAWREAGVEPGQLAQERGWPLPVVLTIDAYRDVPARHTYPTLAEVRAVMAAEFEEIACEVPGYELGERCPTFAFRPR